MAKKKVDPIRPFKRKVWERARGMSDEERLDYYMHERETSKQKKNEGAAEVEFFDKRIQSLMKSLALPFYLTRDNQYEAAYEPYLALSDERDARRFRRYVRKELGEEEAKQSVILGLKYSANPETLEKLGKAKKDEFCRRYGKMRFKCRPASAKTLKGER